MRKIKLYIASSLNGKIAKIDGSVDWLEEIPKPEKADYGYAEFYESIDTTIQGSNTYQQIMDWGIEFPYKGKKNYVITRKKGLENTENVDFISEDHIEFLKKLKEKPGKDIWLIGGGQVNAMLLKAGLIDEFQIFIMPIILPGGIDIFGPEPVEGQLQLVSTKSYSSGVVEMIYKNK